MKEAIRARPRKSLGQHWLTDGRALSRIAAAAAFTDEDTVIEIGAGTGLLTARLAERASCLIAVEVDPALAAALRQRFAAAANVHVLEADVLASLPEALLQEGGGRFPYVVVGNLPYFIGTAIVRHFLQAHVPPRCLLVMLQEEVAASMTAPPGKMTYLAVETQIYATARILFRVPPSAFRPPPKVRSAVVRLDVREVPEIEVDDRQSLFELVHAGFAAPRKRIRNSLAVGLRVPAPQAEAILGAAGIDPAQRPADLSLEDWRRLYFAWRRTARG